MTAESKKITAIQRLIEVEIPHADLVVDALLASKTPQDMDQPTGYHGVIKFLLKVLKELVPDPTDEDVKRALSLVNQDELETPLKESFVKWLVFQAYTDLNTSFGNVKMFAERYDVTESELPTEYDFVEKIFPQLETIYFVLVKHYLGLEPLVTS